MMPKSLTATFLTTALALLTLALLPTSVARAADPADHLDLVPTGVVDLVGADLRVDKADAREAMLLYLDRDQNFETLHRWLTRARLAKGLEDALLMADGIGQSAVAITIAEPEDIQRQTFEALVRASGLEMKTQRDKRAPTWWVSTDTGPPTESQASDRPQNFALLQLSSTVIVAGNAQVVEQIAARRLARRKPKRAAVVEALGDPPEGSELWFVALTPGAEIPDPIQTLGHVNLDGGALIEVRQTCRGEEDASARRASIREWLSAAERLEELAWLELAPNTLAHALVSQVGSRIHVVLTLTDAEVSTMLAAALRSLAPDQGSR